MEESAVQPASKGEGGTMASAFSCRVFSNYSIMPWKNGLGKSSEIAVVPPNINFKVDPFTFRVSMSEISAPCAYSLFEGYDRISLRLAGEEMRLKHNNSATTIVTLPLVPYAFKGEWQTECLMNSNQSVKDIHLIYERRRVQADVKVLRAHPMDSTEKASYEITKKGTTLAYCIEGAVEIFISKDKEGTKEKPDFILNAGETFEMSVIQDAFLSLTFVSTSSPTSTVYLMQMAVKGGKPAALPESLERLLEEGEDASFTYDSEATWKIWNPADESPHKMKGKYPFLSTRARSESFLFDRCAPAEIYKPPPLRIRYSNESEVPPATIQDALNVNEFPRGEVRTAWINLVRNGLGEWVRVPVVVARGAEEGPVLGVTAAVHGNELNGVPCIHRVISALDMTKLKGTVVGVPCVNIPGYLQCTREYSDKVDLNRCFPGKKDGTPSQSFCYAFMERVVKPNFTYLIDLHTASFGRINSYYVRADLNDPVAKTLATLQQPQIILHDGGQAGTLRGAATKAGIKAITVEIGNPQLFQTQFVQWTTNGIMNVLKHFEMFESKEAVQNGIAPVICSKGYWTYTNSGGLLEVYPNVNTLVKKGALVARVKNIFGNYVEQYFADNDCVVIGRSSNPVATQGARIMHVGVLHDGSPLPEAEHENY